MRASASKREARPRSYIHAYKYTCTVTRARIQPEAVYATEISCTSLLHERPFVQHASTPRSCVHANLYLRPARASARPPVRRPRPIHDRPWMMHRLSYVSIGISSLSLPRAPVPSPGPSPLLRSRALSASVFLSLSPPCFSLPFSLSLSPSSASAVLTNAGYNSIVGHDPEAALTPAVKPSRLACRATNRAEIGSSSLRVSFIDGLSVDHARSFARFTKNA